MGKKNERINRCSQAKPTVITNFSTMGNMGKTTELLGVVELIRAAGIEPVYVSADPESNVLLNLYGKRSESGDLTKQSLGDGVVGINMEDKTGALVNILYDEKIEGRDVVVDTKGGVFDSFITEFGGLSDFYNQFPDHRFVSIDCVADPIKGFQNLNRQHEAYADLDTETEIHLVRVFSAGKIGSNDKCEAIIKQYEKFKKDSEFPSNVTIHELRFDTKWTTQDSIGFFSNNRIREALKNERSVNNLLGTKFLNERDRAWSKILFDEEFIEELSKLPNPTDHRNNTLWGKVLKG